jgi:hypothetical protein
MTYFLMMFLGFAVLRALGGAGHYRRRRWERSTALEEKVVRLEGMVTELQEQAEQDRTVLLRLEEERDFLRQLYPTKEEVRS